jgi:hypothetical protein
MYSDLDCYANLTRLNIGHYLYQRDSNLLAYVRFEVLTAVTMKNGVFWDVNAVWFL